LMEGDHLVPTQQSGLSNEFLRIIPLSVHSRAVDLIAENLSNKHDADEVREFASDQSFARCPDKI